MARRRAAAAQAARYPATRSRRRGPTEVAALPCPRADRTRSRQGRAPTADSRSRPQRPLTTSPRSSVISRTRHVNGQPGIRIGCVRFRSPPRGRPDWNSPLRTNYSPGAAHPRPPVRRPAPETTPGGGPARPGGPPAATGRRASPLVNAGLPSGSGGPGGPSDVHGAPRRGPGTGPVLALGHRRRAPERNPADRHRARTGAHRSDHGYRGVFSARPNCGRQSAARQWIDAVPERPPRLRIYANFPGDGPNWSVRDHSHR